MRASCTTCAGSTKIDESIGGISTSGIVDCPDCSGRGRTTLSAEEALRRIHEAFNNQDGSYWADSVLRAVRDTMDDGAPPLRVRGVARVSDEPRAVLVLLTDIASDNQMRELHDFLRDWELP